ncbi:hypothetical protein LEP1GSC041_2082 [Leptospira noguchii str. 2006001870]|nr:hypothetical protein LEP1GSC041_2082 [Leptospira noguchii str. 2006001870]
MWKFSEKTRYQRNCIKSNQFLFARPVGTPTKFDFKILKKRIESLETESVLLQ